MMGGEKPKTHEIRTVLAKGRERKSWFPNILLLYNDYWKRTITFLYCSKTSINDELQSRPHNENISEYDVSQ
jgi:hypothetical protein